MSERQPKPSGQDAAWQRPAYLPPLPNPWPRLEFIPAAADAAPAVPAAAEPPTHPVGLPVEPAASTEQPTDPEKQRTITLAGTVERVPVLTRTPKGKPIAIFPLVVEAPDAQPTQHSILAFDARAAKARTNIRRGDQVEVIGYPHPRQVKQPDGSTKTVSEVYAVRVIRATDRKALV